MKKSRLKRSKSSTTYKVTLVPAANEDFGKLDGSIKKLAHSQFKKLGESPQLGKECGDKYGCNLTGFRSLHFAHNAYRIVYRTAEEEGKVQIWGIGKREDLGIYRMVASRLSEIQVRMEGQAAKISSKAKLSDKSKENKP